MKRKILVVLTLALFSVCAVFFVACEKHEHSYAQEIVLPTCTEKGYTTYSCECGHSYVDSEVDALGHNYTSAVTEPTCIEQGYTTHTCECGHSYVDNEVDALGHSFINYFDDNNATYDSDGTKTAVCDRNGCEATDTIVDEGTKLKSRIEFNTLTLNQDDIACVVLANGTKTFSFIEEVVVFGQATYGVYLDEFCSQIVKTKIVPLVDGDNVFYVYVENVDGGDKIYTINIRVIPIYTINFDTLGGSDISSQTIEEDGLVSEPTTSTKTGYAFIGWDFDFTTPITKDTTITAKWQANTYTVSFSADNGQNIDDIELTYDSVYGELPIAIKAGYTFWGWYTSALMGDRITNETKVKTAFNHTLYARWNLDVEYTLSQDGTYYTATGLRNYSIKDLVILSKYEGKPVTSIGYKAFIYRTSLTSITIPDSVTSIGDDAFNRDRDTTKNQNKIENSLQMIA